MNFIICDDKKEVVDTISEALVKIIRDHEIEGKIILKATRPDDVIDYIHNSKEGVDVYILDVALCDELNGFDIGKELRKYDPLAYVMYVTGHLELSMHSFRYNIKPFEYLIKPVNFREFEDCIVKMEEDYKRSLEFLNMKMQKTIIVSSGYKEYNILIKDIIFIESSAQKMIIHMKNSMIECYGSLSDMAEMLKDEDNTFYRSHKSYIINLNQINMIDYANQQIIMKNDETVYISRKKKKDFKEIFRKFTEEETVIK